MARIQVHCKPGGKTTVKTEGFTGTACQAASAPFEKALGARDTEELTTEFYEEASQEATEEESI